MHIMANIFLPSNEFNDIERISHLVPRTGLYIIDSQLLKGHVYQGISGKQFNEFMMEQVFSTLDLDVKSPQTLVLIKINLHCHSLITQNNLLQLKS